MTRRYRFTLVLAMAITVIVVVLLTAIWPLIAGTNPPGVAVDRQLVTVSIRNVDGRSGFRASAVETLRDLPGIQSLYYAKPTVYMVGYQDQQAEAMSAMVNDTYFQALGVRVQGSGFSRFTPWQRNLPRECVLRPDLQQELTGSPDASLLGQDVDVGHETCRVVGIVDARFEGMRSPTQIRFWLSWPSIIGNGMPEIAPDEYMDLEYRVQELGLVQTGQMSLPALETLVSTRLRQSSPEAAEVRLLAGDGMEPWPRHRMLREIRLVVLAVGALLMVIMTFAVSYALWYGDSMRSTQGVRIALGATAARLIRHAAWVTGLQFAVSWLIGLGLAMASWQWLLAKTTLGQDYLRLSPTLPESGMVLAGLIILGLSVLVCAAEVRVWLLPERGQLASALRQFASRSWVETATAGVLVAATLVASLLAAWILSDYQALRAVPRGYEPGEISLMRFTPKEMKNLFDFPTLTRRGHSVDAVSKTLADWAGTDQVAMSNAAPYRNFSWSQAVKSRQSDELGSNIRVPYNLVTSNFFRLYGIRFVEGGTFSAANAYEVVLSKSAARRLLGEPPWVGRELSLDSDSNGPARLVVGVTEDVAYDGRNSTKFDMHYTPMQQMDRVEVISVAGPVAVNLAQAGEVLTRIGITDRLDAPVLIRDLDAEDDRASLVRAAALLSACLLAVVLGAMGLAELLLVIAQRRLPEFALRSALGATVRRLAWALFRAQLPALLVGLAFGIGTFALAARHLTSRGFNVAPPDSLSVAQAILVLMLVLVLVTIPSLIKLRRIPTALLLKQD